MRHAGVSSLCQKPWCIAFNAALNMTWYNALTCHMSIMYDYALIWGSIMPVSKQKPKANHNRRQHTHQLSPSTLRVLPGMNEKRQSSKYLDTIQQKSGSAVKIHVSPSPDSHQIAVQRIADIKAGRVHCISEDEFARRLALANLSGDPVVDD